MSLFFKTPKMEYVNKSIQIEELEKYAEKEGLPFFKEMNASIWNVFAQYIAEKEGFSTIERLSFGYIISSLIGGLGYSCSTEMYIDEESIEYACVDELNHIREKNLDEAEEVKIFFEFVLDLYKNNLDQYCHKTRTVNVRLTERQYDKFLSVEGETKTDKFLNLLNQI